MRQLFASIFHLTDMHLFVDASGNERDVAELRARLALLIDQAQEHHWDEMLAKLGFQNELAWDRLRLKLPELVAHQRNQDPALPIIVAQTGDVSAFGAELGAEGYLAFPAFQYLHERLWPDLA